MNQIQNKIITVIGHKGYGKTALTEKIAFCLNKPTIIADPRHQYSHENTKRRIFFINVRTFQKWIKENYHIFMNSKLELVVSCDDDDFEDLAETVYKMSKIVFLVDEIDMFFDTKATKSHIMYKIVNFGRHNEIDLITTSRRPASIARTLTSQTDIFYISKITEPLDTNYFKQRYGKEIVSLLMILKKFTFLQISTEEKDIISLKIKELELLKK